MYKEHLPLLKRLHAVADFLAIAVGFLAAGALVAPGQLAENDLWLPLLAGLFWVAFLDGGGLYYSYRAVSGVQIAIDLAKALAQGTIFLVAALWILQLEADRALLAAFVVASFLTLLIERLAVRAILARVRARGRNYNSLLLVGTGEVARGLARTIRRNAPWGIKPIGFLSNDPDEVGSEIDGTAVLATTAELERILSERAIDEVAIAQPEVSADALGRWLDLCAQEGVKTRVFADLYRPPATRQVFEELDGYAMVTFPVAPGVGWQLLIKECVDRVFAFVLLVALAPVMGLIALAVRIDSSGPILFVQERVGLRKRKFRVFKFRTMVEDAERRRADLVAFNEAPEPMFKMRDDPRVTRVGRWLRRTSLDELPQLWNVLQGEMSFIGPRPPLPEEVDRYEGWQRRRLSMKPGISGLWQVAGRGRNLEFAEWVRLDLEYIDNWSLALDLRILLLTVPTILFGRGAV